MNSKQSASRYGGVVVAVVVSLAAIGGVTAWMRTRAPVRQSVAPAPLAEPVAPEESRWTDLELAVLRARQNPQSAALAVEAGALAGDLNEFDEALIWFQRASAIDPKLLPALTGQGQIWLSLRRPARAADAYERALKLAPDEPLLLIELARVYRELRDFPEAVRHARLAEKNAPQDAAVYRALAEIYGDLVLTEESLKYSRQACELGPEDPENWVVQGNLLLRGQRYAEAETVLRRALHLQPTHVQANIDCARALVEGRKTPAADREAFGLLARARLVQPRNSRLLQEMGGIATRAGDLPLAVSLLRQAREASPRDPAILTALGQALIRSRHGEEGVRLVTLSQKLGPRGIGFLDLEELVRKNPDPTLALRLADLYRRQEMYDQAVRVLERGLRRKPGNAQLTARLTVARTAAENVRRRKS